MDLSEALETFAGHRRILVASDFDGTLSDLVAKPDDARPVPGATEVLELLATCPHVNVVLVSGRRLPDLAARFATPPAGVVMIGEHGSVRSDAESSSHPDITRLVAGLEDLTKGIDGAQVEAKLTSVTLHIRNVADETAGPLAERAARYLSEATAGISPRPRVEIGRGVVEVPLSPLTKADAVTDVRNVHGSDAVIFFGDDVSDESVFESLQPQDVGVKVGSAPSAARFRLADPRHVVATLEQLAYLRQ